MQLRQVQPKHEPGGIGHSLASALASALEKPRNGLRVLVPAAAAGTKGRMQRLIGANGYMRSGSGGRTKQRMTRSLGHIRAAWMTRYELEVPVHGWWCVG